METFIIVAAILLGILGMVGSVAPALPGPPLSWLGLLVLYFWGSGTNAAGDRMSLTVLGIWFGVTAAVTFLDYLLPGMLTKVTGGSRYASRGATIGMIAGIILTPVGMIFGSILGAFIAELTYGNKTAPEALKSSLGAFVGFMLGSGLKLIVSGAMLWAIIVYAF